MEVNEVYDLLNNGWIYCIFKDDYFKKIILKKVKEVKNIDNKIFIKKSKKVYKILKNIGMETATYDSIVVIVFNKFNMGLKFDLISISNADSLIQISKRIVYNDDF